MSAELSVIDEVTVTDLTVEEFETETVEFFDEDVDNTEIPVVIAQTRDASVVDGSVSRSVDRGDAATATTQTVEFDSDSPGGTTILAVGNEPLLPMQGVESSSSTVDDADWVDSDEDTGAAQLAIDGEFDETLSVTLEGYAVGDVTLNGNVGANDATEIAEQLVSGDDILEYGDVTDDGEITAVDAMKIQQYHEGERDESYNLNGGS